MKKQNFFSWYYGDGIHQYLEIWRNYILFFMRYFSIADLLLTIFYPWKRDMGMKTWRGFDLSRSFQLWMGNLFSRFIGMIVRLCVIGIGVAVTMITILLGFLFLLSWILFPAFVIVAAVMAIGGSTLWTISLGVLFFVISMIVIAYAIDSHKEYENMSLDEIYESPIFKRVCGRIGVEKEEISKKIFLDQKEFDGFLKKLQVSREEFNGIVEDEFLRIENVRAKKYFWRKENLEKVQPIGRQWKYAYTVNLDKYSNDLSEYDASDYRKEELVGREGEKELMRLVFQRPDQNNVMVVAPSGIGKKTLIHSFAREIREGRAERAFREKRIVLLDLGRVIGDALNRGLDVDGVLQSLFVEVTNAGNIILVIEHLENFLGKEGNVYHPDISPILNQFLTYPTFQIIATSTPREYHSLIEKHEELIKYFEVVEMSEPSEEEAAKILYNKLSAYEKSQVLFTHRAILAAIHESGRYNWSVPLPERAVDLIMDTLTFWHKNPKSRFITEQTVLEFLSIKTGTPQGEIGDDERKKLLNMEEILHRYVIGQEEAIRQVAEAMRRSRSGISDREKPVGSFLFLGPTGVGKTETAKALARSYFGDENRMIRLDMSEFQSPNSIDRLLGSTSRNQPGRLVTMIKDNPYSLLLLDEIEKAYPDVLDIFLQVLDEGYVTDAFGEKVNFRNAIIIATSNAGAPLIKDQVEKGVPPEDIKKNVIDHAVEQGMFRVEFLNRFDDVIFFRPLNANELVSVVKLMLGKFARRVEKEKNIEIEFGENVPNVIIEKGYNSIFGARSVKHYIEDSVEDFIAKKIIAGEVKGGEKIKISL